MSLQLTLGGSGSGKSQSLYRKMIREAVNRPDTHFIVLVPEQFTMQTQRELVFLHPAHGLLNMEVQSFQRLAWRVFEEAGEDGKQVLSETGKNLLLRRAAASCREELSVLGSRMEKKGYVTKVKSILSEFAQYDIVKEQLLTMIDLAGSRPQLMVKLKDLVVLKDAFEQMLGENLVTGEQLLGLLANAVRQSALLQKSEIALDGFTGFTPVQMKVVEALLTTCRNVHIALTLGEGEQTEGEIREHELFALSKKTIRGVYALARRNRVTVEEPVWCRNAPGRFRPGSDLARLEQTLFRPGLFSGITKPEGEERQVFLRALADPWQESLFVAEQVKKLVWQKGLRYREIAVITADLATYEGQLGRVFTQHAIPFFADRNVALEANPCLEFLRGAIRMAEENFSYESVMHFLKSGYFALDRETVDVLENYVLATGIRGRRRWEEQWTATTQTMGQEEAAVCDRARQTLMEKLSGFLSALSRTRACVREYLAGIRSLLKEFDLKEQLALRALRLKERDLAERAMEYEQVYQVLEDLLEEAENVLPEQECTRKDFAGILEAGFEEARVGILPPGLDQVQIGEVQRTRLSQIKVLFFMGMNDTLVPPATGNYSLMSEEERSFMASCGLNLAPDPRENGYIQRFYLYLLLTKPSDCLFVSYSHASADGTALRPSYLVGTLSRLLQVPVVQVPEQKAHRPYAMKAALSGLAGGLRLDRQEGKASDYTLELLSALRASKDYAPALERMLGAVFKTGERENLEGSLARLLYAPQEGSSVTRLETYAACAYEYFLTYGLNLKEREEYRIRPLDIGNLFHEVLCRFSLELEQSGFHWKSIDEESQNRLLEQCLDDCLQEGKAGIFSDGARNAAMALRLRRILKRTVHTLVQQIRAGDFTPAAFEVPFSEGGHEDVRIETKYGPIRLRGRIDRIDRYETGDEVYLKVIDYKSGNTAFDLAAVLYGLQMQLAVYLGTAVFLQQRKEEKGTGRTVHPGAMFYYRMKDPITEQKKEMDDSEAEELAAHQLLLELRPDGLMNSADAVLHALDRNMGRTSEVVRASRGKEGFKSSQAASEEQLEQLCRHVDTLMEELAGRILEGEIPINPYRRKNGTACERCPHRGTCSFDRKLSGSAYRELKEMDDTALWRQIAASGRQNHERVEESKEVRS